VSGKDEHHGHRQRLRQRFLAAPEALPDYELLELLLAMALPRRDTKPLSKTLLKRFGDFANVVNASPQELAGVDGIGEAGVAALRTVQEAAARLVRSEAAEAPLLGSWDRVRDYCKLRMEYAKVEQLRLLFLNSKNRLIADEVQHVGTIDETPVYPREVVRRAIELGATAVILVHNHPSGDPTPSALDIDVTRQVQKALSALDIELHDHLVVGRGRIVSLRREGLL
jgi:DNA repair protein RadC